MANVKVYNLLKNHWFIGSFFFKFVLTTKAGLSPHFRWGGKSGQRRAAHHLTGGIPRKQDTESATENNRLLYWR